MDGRRLIQTKKAYKSPRHAQVWFLERSRETWKSKYMLLKAGQRRLENKVRDVTKSRKNWEEKSRNHLLQVKALEAEVSALKAQIEVLKKLGARSG